MMKLFKAWLWSVSVVSLTVRAAPQDLLAGRVSLSHGVGHLSPRLGLLSNLQSLSPFLSSGGLPAFSLVRAVPQVQQTQTVRQEPLSPLPPLPPLPTVLSQEEELPARYNFGYSVADQESGDSKTRQESRDGDLVTGSYSVADPDGRIRTVTYTADSEHGFQAKVTYDGEEGPVAIPFHSPAPAIAPALAPALAPAPAPVPAPVQASAPVTIARELGQGPAGETLITDNQPRLANNAETLNQASVANIANNFPQFFTNGARLFPTGVTSLASGVPRGATSLVSDGSRLIQVPRVFNTVRALPTLQTPIQSLFHNNLHGVHGLHHGVALRAGAAAPLDLSQFTFLSNGQVLAHGK